MNIVGLGNTGCNVAKIFENYPQYRVFQIDTEEREGKNTFLFPQFDHPEDYERGCPDLSGFLDIQGDVFFILGGPGSITGASLRILEQIKHCNISIIYFKSDQSLLSNIGQLHQRATFHILQEYTRSGVFKEIFLLDNQVISGIIGDVPIVEYYSRINNLVVPIIHFINVFNNTKPVMSTFSNLAETSKIKTLSILNMEDGTEKAFFSLDSPVESRYYYGIGSESLKNDSTLNNKIRNQMKISKVKTGFGIYETSYNYNFCYGVLCSREIATF